MPRRKRSGSRTTEVDDPQASVMHASAAASLPDQCTWALRLAAHARTERYCFAVGASASWVDEYTLAQDDERARARA
jgi:hypothetical protein